MTQLAAGNFPFKVTSASFGSDERGVPVVQINGTFTEGPNAGRTTTYQDEVNAKSAIYISRSCKAVGWCGRELETLAADTEAWIKKTGGATTAEIRHILLKRGKKYDKWQDDHAKWVDAGRPEGKEPKSPYWDKCNSIGFGAKPLVAPNKEVSSDANDAMRRAMEADGAAPDDASHAATAVSGAGYKEEGFPSAGGPGAGGDFGPAGRDDDLPFATCLTISTGEIARVLRGAL